MMNLLPHMFALMLIKGSSDCREELFLQLTCLEFDQILHLSDSGTEVADAGIDDI